VTHTVREATIDDADSVVRLLDAAMLSFDREQVRRRVDAGDVLVAVVRGYNREERRAGGGGTSNDDERVVGACVLGRDPTDVTEIEQIAVHQSRRGRGIGTTLVDAAATRADGPLVARFRERVRPFYESLGFEIDAVDSGETPSAGETGDTHRLRGVLR
jgi:N-acetylglutamate synthase-like GNAT family acetyltransferase